MHYRKNGNASRLKILADFHLLMGMPREIVKRQSVDFKAPVVRKFSCCLLNDGSIIHVNKIGLKIELNFDIN
jgi:hypothetical protein